ncbi:CRISPR-associated endonuclease Cas2 [Candidatus Saccharibacteria bacterium RIFCSPHIGHO2_12_FULL_48_21]|nr:MAG: CRISPR-associated endonuclease Cas2 [Candidatus Saccharibacteria bacterium RIFCSPHIGHO2_12_FULL_48_21]
MGQSDKTIIGGWARKREVHLKKPLRERSPLVYVLVALIPYSKPNLLLSYKPSLFFNELEKVSRYKKSTLQKAYNRGLKNGLIHKSADLPKLTALGKRKIAPYTAGKLGDESQLLVIFDVPESRARARRTLRLLLRAWGFKQVQKSVWASNLDYREVLVEVIDELDLKQSVEVHESVRLYPKK